MSTPIGHQKKQSRAFERLEDHLSEVLTTDKQKKFLRNRLAGLNKRQAAIQAGYAPSTASIMAKRLTDKLECNRYFLEEAHRQGFTVEAIIGELKRGMTEAMHPLHPDQPDNYNRRAFLDIAMRLFGAYAPTKVDLDIQKKEVTIIITPEIIERLERYDRQRAQLEATGHIVLDLVYLPPLAEFPMEKLGPGGRDSAFR